MEKEQSRIAYIDLYRGIGIILMIALHVGFGKTLDHIVHAFHMPMFFFVSGYFFKPGRSAGSFFASKIKGLLIPYVVFTCLLYGLSAIFLEMPSASLEHALLFMNDGTAGVVTPTWFLTALFFAESIYFGVHVLSDNIWLQTIAISVITIAGFCLSTFTDVLLPFSIGVSLVGVAFVHLGFLLHSISWKQNRFRLLELPPLVTIVLTVIVMILAYLSPLTNMRDGIYPNPVLFLLNAILGCIALWNISALAWAVPVKPFHSAMETISNIGKRSIIFLCMNIFVIRILFLIYPASGKTFLHNVVVLLLTLLILYLLSFCHSKFKEIFIQIVKTGK